METANSSVIGRIIDKYQDENEHDFGFIMFVVNSPKRRNGLLVHSMTLCDYDINEVGTGQNLISLERLSHITELDLTDNLLASWNEVFVLLKTFPGLKFLNLSNNLLCNPLSLTYVVEGVHNSLRKVVFNGNKVCWNNINVLTNYLPALEELYLNSNCLENPSKGTVICHKNLRQLFLGCNLISDFANLSEVLDCPQLLGLSLTECPIENIPNTNSFGTGIECINLSITKICSWDQVDNLMSFKNLRDLRFRGCPVLNNLSLHERRMMLISRLPHVKILNGGDCITDDEREDAERAFVRYYLSAEPFDQPHRFHELVAIHGLLDPLVNVNMTPKTTAKVSVVYGQLTREEEISMYQSVAQFKALLHKWFDIPTQIMRLFYCDKVMVEASGPEELKWPQKLLYTYNVQDGDKFILDEKVVCLGKLKLGKSSRRSISSSPTSSSSSSAFNAANKISYILNASKSAPTPSCPLSRRRIPSSDSKVVRNLFGRQRVSMEETQESP